MVTDSPRLNPDNTPADLNLALSYSVPVLLWAAGVAGLADESSTPVSDVASQSAETLFIVQALSITLIAPWYATQGRLTDALIGLLIVVVIPLPLLSVIWLTGAVDAPALAAGQLFVTGLSVLLLVLARSLHAVISQEFPRNVTTAGIQVCAAVVTWVFHPQWLALAGL